MLFVGELHLVETQVGDMLMHLHFDPVSLLTGARNQTIILHLMNVQTGYHVLTLMQS